MPRREIIFHKAWSLKFASSKYYTSRVWPFELLSASPKECSLQYGVEKAMKNVIVFCCHWSQRQGLRCTWVTKSWTKDDNISFINFPMDHLNFYESSSQPPQRTVSALLMHTKLQLSMYNRVHGPSCFRLRVKPCSSLLSLQTGNIW